MKYPLYPRYKASGVDWVGDVPSHWEVKRLKHTVFRADEKVEADEDNPVPYIGLENIESWVGRLLSLNSEIVPTGVSNRFKAGDTLFGKLRPYLAKGINVDLDGVCSSELLVLRSPGHNRRFLLYRLLTDGFISTVDSSTYGAKMPRASWDFIGACAVPVPPLNEQHAIADFLDRETAKLDTLVEKKRALIEKLKEKRAALISRTVTRGLPPDAARAAGLNPHPKLKPSGIDWLGDVPSHWCIKPLKRAIQSVEGPGIMASDFLDEGVPLIRIAGIGDRVATLEGCNFLSPDLVKERWSHFRVALGDLLISGSASTGFCSEVDDVTTGAIPYTGIIIVRPRKQESEKNYIRWFFLSEPFLLQATLARTGSTIQHFGPSHLSRMVVTLPPVPEQVVIADYLDRETAKIDRMVEKVEKAIARLQEYRTALITAAVTGKIDVRRGSS